MTDFTRDFLRFCVRVGTDRPETFNIASRDNPDANIASLAAFAIALLDRAETAEAERDRMNDLLRRIEGLDEKADAISWEQQAEDRGNLALQIAAERDRLKKELEEAEDVINALYDWAYAQTWTQEDDAIVHYVTPEMAHDAGDPSMTGSPIYGKVSCEFCLAESGEPWRDLMDSNAAVRRARERAK